MLLASASDVREAAEWGQIAMVLQGRPIICLACGEVSGNGKPTFYTANEAVQQVDEYSSVSESVPRTGDSIRSVQVSRDRQLAIARGNVVEIWKSGLLIMTLNHPDTVNSMVWNEGLLVSAANTEVFIWDTSTSTLIQHIEFTSFVQNVVISPDRTMILAHTGQRYYIWSLSDPNLKEDGVVATSASLSCASIGKARALIGCSDGQCFSVPLGTGGAGQVRLWGHTKNVRSVHISKDETRGVTGSWDCTLRVWDLKTGEVLRELSDIHTAYVTAGRFFGKDDSYVVSGSSDSTLRVFDLHQNDRARVLALMHRSRRDSMYQAQVLPVDVLRRVKSMLFGSAVE